MTTFNITGLAIHNILQEAGLQIETVFIDTLHHFSETYQLMQEYEATVFRPKHCQTENDFVLRYGKNLWESQPERYSFYTKQEPKIRMYKTLKPFLVINGRRQSQGTPTREKLDLFEMDKDDGVLKMQLLYDWSESEVSEYLEKKHVKKHPLYSQGYRSIGDYHSTFSVREEAGERSGRKFFDGKMECGLHV